jgi:hypothetical protein
MMILVLFIRAAYALCGYAEGVSAYCGAAGGGVPQPRQVSRRRGPGCARSRLGPARQHWRKRPRQMGQGAEQVGEHLLHHGILAVLGLGLDHLERRVSEHRVVVVDGEQPDPFFLLVRDRWRTSSSASWPPWYSVRNAAPDGHL